MTFRVEERGAPAETMVLLDGTTEPVPKATGVDVKGVTNVDSGTVVFGKVGDVVFRGRRLLETSPFVTHDEIEGSRLVEAGGETTDDETTLIEVLCTGRVVGIGIGAPYPEIVNGGVDSAEEEAVDKVN